MKTKSVDKRVIVVFPFFVALFPIIHLYRENVDELEFSMVLPSIINALLIVSVGWAVLFALTKSASKSGLIVSWLMTLFSFYYTYNGWIAQIIVVLIMSNWLIYFICKSESKFRGLVAFLNASSIVAVGLPGYGIATELLNPPPEVDGASEVLSEKQIQMKGTTPNVYFIILDGYGGQKALSEFYRTENRRFVSFLEQEGFWVSKASRSNYMRTILSLPATLNLEYLDEFIKVNDLELSDDARPFTFLLHWNYVKGFLNNFGYDTVGISSGFAGWDMIGADHYLDLKTSGMNQFQAMLHAHTPVYPIIRELALEDPFANHRQLQIDTIAKIPEIPLLHEGPIFTFAHILCPHPPFVFGDNGELVRPEEPRFHLGDGSYLVGTTMDVAAYRMAYIKQLDSLNTIMMDAIATLRKNDPGAIIIVQGDHGPGSELVWSDIEQTNLRERSSILNAIYFPDQDYTDLYDTLSSVNTFRIVFNKFFGAEHEILPDLHYFSESGLPYLLYNVGFEDEIGSLENFVQDPATATTETVSSSETEEIKVGSEE